MIPCIWWVTKLHSAKCHSVNDDVTLTLIIIKFWLILLKLHFQLIFIKLIPFHQSTLLSLKFYLTKVFIGISVEIRTNFINKYHLNGATFRKWKLFYKNNHSMVIFDCKSSNQNEN